MPGQLLAAHDGLVTHRRLAWPAVAGPRFSLADLVLLVNCGIAAVLLTDLIEFRLRLPGHAILRGVLPLSLGLAMVPRYGAGTVMGLASLGAGLVLRTSGGTEGGLGSFTSTTLLGPLLDLLLAKAGHPAPTPLAAGCRVGGRWIYAGIVAAAVGANLAALAVQLGARMSIGRPLAHWLPLAAVTYPAFGLVAGFLSAAVAFQFRRREPS